jgi:hypothetical protein
MKTTGESIDLETLRGAARVAGFTWTDAELESIRVAVEQAQAALRDLEAVPLGDVEPTAQYRVI